MSASCRDTSAERIAQCRSTRIWGKACWNSTRRGASQNVPRPSVTATRTSPESALATELPARNRSNDALSMRSTAETTSAPSSVSRVPWTSRVNRVAPIWRSKSSIRRRTTLMDDSRRSAADLKLPQRTTSRKILAASQSARPPREILRSSGGTPLSVTRRIHNPLYTLGCQIIERVTTTTRRSRGFCDACVHAEVNVREYICTTGDRSAAKRSTVSQVVNPRPFVNTSNVPIVVLGDVQPGWLGKPRLLDPFYRNHRVTYRCDSSASQPWTTCRRTNPSRRLQDFRSMERRYETADWIAATLSRELGFGKNADG